MKKSNTSPQQLSPERFIRERGRSIPIEVCYMDQNSLREMGESQAIVVRQHKGGRRTIGCYLIDAWCRGVKDTFYAVRMEKYEYEEVMRRMLGNPAMNMEEVPYEVLHNWIYGAVEFAEEAGLKPHKDFATSKYLLEEDDERIPLIEYEFGLNGKHHLVCNTVEDLMRLKPILDKNLGQGNYTFATNPYADDGEEEV